jgi:hypothetical protein
MKLNLKYAYESYMAPYCCNLTFKQHGSLNQSLNQNSIVWNQSQLCHITIVH